ncbi:MAG: sigma-70 family RNA polymerase sigma factor, partial [Anaeroplasmataceae bacterium]|nr:sigma-70 family RNA polymerase sigma factor [Anaeroplasmataceae bacterium]
SKYVERYEDVEELTDDVFIQFFNHLENLKPEKEIKYYLMTSAKNIAINFLKKQRYVEVIDEELVGNYVQVDTSYAHLIKDWQQFLTQEEINLILNHVLYGFSLKQLAEKNNKSSNTVKSQYRRSIKKLKQFYQEA